MRAAFLILSLWIVFFFVSCDSAKHEKHLLVDPGTRILSLEESLSYIEQQLDKNPSVEELIYRKAETLFQLGKYEEATEALSSIRKPFKDVRYELLDIQLNLEQNNIDEALIRAEYLFNEKGVESILLNELLAQLYARKKEFLKAIDHVNYCIDKNAEAPKYSYLKGLYYYNFKDTVNAYFYIEKALNSGYKDMNGIVLYADLLMASNKPDEALEIVNKNLSRDPDNTKLRNSLAKILNMKEMFQKSRQISFELIEGKYTGYEPFLNLADAYLDIHDYDSAIFFAEKALNIHPQLNEAYYIIGKAHRANEEVYNAYNAYSKILEYDPGDPYALSEMRKLENYIAYLQRIRKEYESRPILPALEPKRIDNR